MKKRMLGNSGLEVAPLAFGGNVFGWTADEPTSFRLLDAFVAAGRQPDRHRGCLLPRGSPATRAGNPRPSSASGSAKNGNREKVLVATKVGKDMGAGRSGLSKSYILRAAEDSPAGACGRTASTCTSPTRTTRRRRWRKPWKPLRRWSGRERSGRSARRTSTRGGSRSRWMRARGWGFPPTAACSRCTTCTTGPSYEKTLEPLCLEKGLGVIPYFSLASGFLTGKYRSEERPCESGAQAGIRQELPERAGFSHPRRPGPGGGGDIARPPPPFPWRG